MRCFLPHFFSSPGWVLSICTDCASVVCAELAFGSWNTLSAAQFLSFPDRVPFARRLSFAFSASLALYFFSPIPLAPLPFVNHSPSVRFKGPSELRFGLSTGRWPSGSVAVGILPAIRFVASGLPWSSSDSDSLSDSYCHPLRALTLAGAELFR